MFSDEELDRYQRHIVLKEVGGEGQRKFKAATVAVVGAGGLGSHVCNIWRPPESGRSA